MISAVSPRKPWFVALILGASWLLLLLLLWLATQHLEERWELGVFAGRFHILLVHLPIGLLLGVAAVEIASLVPSFRQYEIASLPMLWLSFLGAIAATLAGYLLMRADQFSGTQMTLHLWTGLAVVALLLVTLLLKILPVSKPAYLGSLGASVVLICVSGHYGGNLVHGEDYLTEFAPEPFASLLTHGDEAEKERSTSLIPVLERIIYPDIIQPIFDAKCVECHYEGKVKGDLRMDSFEWLAKGGDYGASFVPGDAEASELYYRVTCDPDDDDFMPPSGKGEPMTEAEVTLMGWWISAGASPDMTVDEGKPTPEILALVDAFFTRSETETTTPSPES